MRYCCLLLLTTLPAPCKDVADVAIGLAIGGNDFGGGSGGGGGFIGPNAFCLLCGASMAPADAVLDVAVPVAAVFGADALRWIPL